MLQRDAVGAEPHILTVRAYVVDVTVDQTAPTPEVLGQKIADALLWVEGCGEVNVGYLGPMETVDEDSVKGTV